MIGCHREMRSYKEALIAHRDSIRQLKSCSPEYQLLIAKEQEEKALKDAQAALLGKAT